MNGPHFAWELFKLTLGVCLILFAAIYTVARIAAAFLNIDPYEPRLCGAESWIGVTDWVSCDLPVGHDGDHHDDAFDVDWSEAPAIEVAP